MKTFCPWCWEKHGIETGGSMDRSIELPNGDYMYFCSPMCRQAYLNDVEQHNEDEDYYFAQSEE